MMRFAALLFALLVCVACEGDVKKVPATQVLVRIEATNEVRDSTYKLRLHTSSQASKKAGWVDRKAIELDVDRDASGDEGFWPVDIPVVPEDPERLPELFQIVAEALDEEGHVVVEQRAITSFVKQSQLVLEITLARCGEAPLGTVCENDKECHGTECQSCREGVCTATAVTDSSDLLPIKQATKNDDATDGGGPSAAADGGAAGAGGTGGKIAEQAGASGDAGAAGKAAAGSGGMPQAGAAAGSGGTTRPASPEPFSWTAPALLESGVADVYLPQMSTNRSGDAVVGWWQDESDGYLWMRRYVDGSWEADTFRVNGPGAPNPENRAPFGIGIDGAGIAQVFFRGVGPTDVNGNAPYKGFWVYWTGMGSVPLDQPPRILGDQVYGYPNFLSVREAGGSTAVWAGAPDISPRPMYVNVRGPMGWGTPVEMGSLTDELSALGFGANDSGAFASVVVTGNAAANPAEQKVTTFIGQGTSASTVPGFDLPDPVTTGFVPVEVDSMGNAVTVLFQGEAVSTAALHWSRYDAAQKTWTPLAQLAAAARSYVTTTLRSGEPAIVWTNVTTGDTNGRIAFARVMGAAGWSSPVMVSDEIDLEDTLPMVASNAAGDLVVVWDQTATLSGNPGRAIAYNRFTKTGGWGKPGIIATVPGQIAIVGVTLSTEGQAMVVYSQAATAGAVHNLYWARSR